MMSVATSESWLNAWHFVHPDRRFRWPIVQYGEAPVATTGRTYRIEGQAYDFNVGLRDSQRPVDAMHLGDGPVACKVNYTVDHGVDQRASLLVTVLGMADATRVLHEFAIWCARGALERERGAGHEPDERFWAAIAAKEAWLRGEISDAELKEANERALQAYRRAIRDIDWHTFQWTVGPAHNAVLRAMSRDPVQAARHAALSAIWSSTQGSVFSVLKAAKLADDDALYEVSEQVLRDVALQMARDEINSELEKRLEALLI